jgi:hypothetical protein
MPNPFARPLPPAIARDLPAIVEEALYAALNPILDRIVEELGERGLYHGFVEQDSVCEKLSGGHACGDGTYGLALDINDQHVHIEVNLAGLAAAAASRTEQVKRRLELIALANTPAA